MTLKQYIKLCSLLSDFTNNMTVNQLNQKYHSLIPNNLIITHVTISSKSVNDPRYWVMCVPNEILYQHIVTIDQIIDTYHKNLNNLKFISIVPSILKDTLQIDLIPITFEQNEQNKQVLLNRHFIETDNKFFNEFHGCNPMVKMKNAQHTLKFSQSSKPYASNYVTLTCNIKTLANAKFIDVILPTDWTLDSNHYKYVKLQNKHVDQIIKEASILAKQNGINTI